MMLNIATRVLCKLLTKILILKIGISEKILESDTIFTFFLKVNTMVDEARLTVYERDTIFKQVIQQSLDQISGRFIHRINKKFACKRTDFKVEMQAILHQHVVYKFHKASRKSGRKPYKVGPWRYEYFITEGICTMPHLGLFVPYSSHNKCQQIYVMTI